MRRFEYTIGRVTHRRVLFVATLLSILSPVLVQDAQAQFLRLGPFDFTARMGLDLIYTTNVDEVRPSETDQEMEDYYLSWSLDLLSQADVAPSTKLTLDTGLTVEKHFVRTDLDNSEDPFGRARASSLTEFGHYQLTAFAGYERQYEEDEEGDGDTFVPGSITGKDAYDEYEYGVGLKWQRDPFTIGGDYEMRSERHLDEKFQAGDKDETTLNFLAAWQFAQDMGIRYQLEKTKTVLVNDPDADEGYDNTQTIALDARLRLIKRPEVTYSLGLEKEDTDEEDGEWEPIHSLNAKDDWYLTPTLHLGLNATYEYEQNPEADDISFIYGGFLDHDISPTAKQSITATREPVSTFGSTSDTDQTTYGYAFTKHDLFIYNLTFNFAVTYEISEPLDGGETENILAYDASLSYARALSSRLTRELRYDYSLEDSNLKDELLEEHRVTLSYVYDF